MNYKNLNYEIETGGEGGGGGAAVVAMNYKNLNYEIETEYLPFQKAGIAYYEL